MNNSKIILINKRKGISSFKEINRVRREQNFDKIGHAGTLDPLAEGLIIAMSNRATKLSDMLMKKSKIYFVEMTLGFETDTLDLEGKIIKTDKIPENIRNNFFKIIDKFNGDIEQIPPKYSAIKVNGKKLYNLARKNVDINIPKRTVNIKYIKDIEFKSNDKIRFRVKVSSGTYIRSLVRDIAYELGTVATMSYLLRESVDIFKNPKNIEILNVDDVIVIDKVNLTNDEYLKIKNGQTIKFKYNGKDSKLHCYNKNKYVGICDILHKNCGITSMKRSSFFE